MHQMQVPNCLGTSHYCTVKGTRHRGSLARSLGHSRHSVIIAAEFFVCLVFKTGWHWVGIHYVAQAAPKFTVVLLP